MTTSVANLPAGAYPVTFVFTDSETGEVWHTITVEGPGVMQIPSCKDHGIEHTDVTVRFASGEVHHEKYQP